MNLNEITPLILTFNEERNIERCLEPLNWATRVVILDSGSSDQTVAIAKRFSNVEVFSRSFDQHARQWSYGIQDTRITTPWILGLDCDYVVSPEVVAELRSRQVGDSVSAFEIGFDYFIYGTKLPGTVYPPVKALFRPGRCRMLQDGHTHRLEVLSGTVERLHARLGHDDWKLLSHWLGAQSRYHDLEVAKLNGTPTSQLKLADRLRKRIYFAPFLMFGYCLFVRGLLFGGKPGLTYAFQRLVSELILSLKLLEQDLAQTGKRPSAKARDSQARAS